MQDVTTTGASTPPRRVQLARPDVGDRELELVTQVLTSDVLALGPFAPRFERAIASMVGRAEAIACSSGTAGLHMGVRALGLGEGDEVLTTPFSFVASANCLLYERAIPRFVDIEEDSLGMDPDRLAAAATSRTRAILPVHVFGRPCRIEDLVSQARARDWAIIEDSCEGLGSTVAGKPLGSFGDLAVFAFYPNKQITTGEGGMVVTDDPSMAEAIRSMRNQGRDAGGTWLRHVRLGFNYRLDELSAALGVAQVERIDELRAGRARVASLYERRAWVEGLGRAAASRRERIRRLVRLRRSSASGDRPRSDHRAPGGARSRLATVFQPAPSPTVLPTDVRLQTG